MHGTVLFEVKIALRVANPPAPYRAQNQENLEIPFSEPKNTLVDPQHGTYLNGHFGAFNSPPPYMNFYTEGELNAPKWPFK